MWGWLLMKNNLKTQLCNKLVEEEKVQEGDVIRHSYSSNRLENGDKNLGRIENHEGLSPTLDTRCDCLGVVVNENKSVFTKLEKEMITKDGNIKRYLGSSQIDEFKEGQMATLNYPNGYGHGTRVHNESVALTTGQTPIVKNNLRIRKLTPKETVRLMGFTDEDYQAMRDIGMSDAAIYHMAGDSIVVTVLMSIFSQLLFEDDRHKHIVQDYIKKGVIENR